MRPCFSIYLLLVFSISCAFLLSKEVILSDADLPKDFAAVLMVTIKCDSLTDASPLSVVLFTSAEVEDGGEVGEEDLKSDDWGLTLAGSTLKGTGRGSGTGSGTLPSRKLVIVKSTF